MYTVADELKAQGYKYKCFMFDRDLIVDHFDRNNFKLYFKWDGEFNSHSRKVYENTQGFYFVIGGRRVYLDRFIDMYTGYHFDYRYDDLNKYA